MKKRRVFYQHRSQNENSEGIGQDSFLDIVSNVVGILIILVMVAGARVGSIQSITENKTPDSVAAPQTDQILSNPNLSENRIRNDKTAAVLKEDKKNSEIATDQKIPEEIPSEEEIKEFIALCQKFEKNRDNIINLHKETAEINQQLEKTKQLADGAEIKHTRMIEDLSKFKAAVELESEKKAAGEKILFDLQRENADLDSKITEVKLTKEALEKAPKNSITLENRPTPLGKKVDGHEAFFVVKNKKISHIPMNVFSERLRSFFRNYRDINKTIIHEKIGPVEGYSFIIQASLHQVRQANQSMISFNFDYGECVPENDNIGETLEDALKDGSVFRQKLSLYLQERSTVTLWVYPNSYHELRELKKHLLDHGYNIALRPMDNGRPIRFSPDGSKSVSY